MTAPHASPANECEHGQLARSCELCEMRATIDRINRDIREHDAKHVSPAILEQQLIESQAHNAELRAANAKLASALIHARDFIPQFARLHGGNFDVDLAIVDAALQSAGKE